jgi:hypothetical protein
MKLQAPRHTGLLIAFILMAASAVAFRRGVEATSAAEQKVTVQELKEKLEKLEKEVADLRRQLEQLRPATQGFVLPGSRGPFTPRRSVPPNWNRFELNGMEYYLAPAEKPPSGRKP